MKIDVKSREGKPPLHLTHAVCVEDVPVGFGGQRQCESVAKTLRSDPQTAIGLRKEFISEPEEW